jgi:hypothetical protein
MKYAVRKMMSDGSIDPRPKKKKGEAPVDQSELPPDNNFYVESEDSDPEFKTQQERQAYMMNKAMNKMTPEDVAARDQIYDDMIKNGTATGDPKKDMKTATETYILTKGGFKSEGLEEDEEMSAPLVGGNNEQVRMGRKMNKMTTQGSGYDYNRGVPAKGSITRRMK